MTSYDRGLPDAKVVRIPAFDPPQSLQPIIPRNGIASNQIDPAIEIRNRSIAGKKLLRGTVTGEQLADGAVGPLELQYGTQAHYFTNYLSTTADTVVYYASGNYAVIDPDFLIGPINVATATFTPYATVAFRIVMSGQVVNAGGGNYDVGMQIWNGSGYYTDVSVVPTSNTADVRLPFAGERWVTLPTGQSYRFYPALRPRISSGFITIPIYCEWFIAVDLQVR